MTGIDRKVFLRALSWFWDRGNSRRIGGDMAEWSLWHMQEQIADIMTKPLGAEKFLRNDWSTRMKDFRWGGVLNMSSVDYYFVSLSLIIIFWLISKQWVCLPAQIFLTPQFCALQTEVNTFIIYHADVFRLSVLIGTSIDSVLHTTDWDLVF